MKNDTEICDTCKGSGMDKNEVCSACNGKGVI
jgi:DnaJ-class molecular chaperone